MPLVRASLRVHCSGVSVQAHAVPVNPVAVRPDGNVSATVTVPDVGPVPLFVTVIVYVAPGWPATKLPACVLVMVRSGTLTASAVSVTLVDV